MPKAPPFFTVAGLLEPGATVALDARARRHARARRLAAGGAVRLADGAGNEAEGTIARISRDALEVRVGRVAAAPPRAGIELYVSAIRLPRLSWLVEKATELGAGAVTIVASDRAQRERVEGAASGRARLERIVREAAEQSGQAAPPR
ncbi:MAG TPA: RsmE family RNA methyltransferase, partial [Thermoanaerobaculia bacterium]|nr:RsmE family RNA methyltransferase [Thermoanaerobaculia bacterium]